MHRAPTSPFAMLRAVREPLAALAVLLMLVGAVLPGIAIGSPTHLCAEAEGDEPDEPACPVILAVLVAADDAVPPESATDRTSGVGATRTAGPPGITAVSAPGTWFEARGPPA